MSSLPVRLFSSPSSPFSSPSPLHVLLFSTPCSPLLRLLYLFASSPLPLPPSLLHLLYMFFSSPLPVHLFFVSSTCSSLLLSLFPLLFSISSTCSSLLHSLFTSSLSPLPVLLLSLFPPSLLCLLSRVLLFSVSSPSYPLDVARRRMQLGVVLPESDKCRTLTKTLEYVYSQYGVKKGLYRGLSLNYICCVPSQAVAFFTYELMKQTLHLN